MTPEQLAYFRAYRAAHAEQFKRYRHDWYTRSPRGRAAAQRRAERQSHPKVPDREKVREQQHAWYLARQEELVCRASESSARLRFGGERIPWQVYRDLRAEPCLVCGRRPSNGVDHLVPRRLGGRHVVENLLPMCRPCNSRKSNRERAAALRMERAS